MDNISTLKGSNFKFASGGILEVKSIDDQLIVKGYIATTHKDTVNDVATKETLEKWAKEINEGVPRSNKVTYHHDRNDIRVVGVGVKGSARVDQLPDGEFGLYTETIINKSHDLYSDIEYEYNIGALDSFSIEYTTPEGAKEDTSFRVLGPDTELYGWTLASRPVNDKAVMIKELLNRAPALPEQSGNKEMITSHSHNLGSKEMGIEKKSKMAEEEQSKVTDAQLKELQELKEYKKQMDAEKKAADEKKVQEEEEQKKKDAKMADEQKKELTEQIVALKEVIGSITESKQSQLDVEKKEDAVRVEVKELQKTFSKDAVSYKELANSVGNYLAKRGLQSKEDLNDLSYTKTNGEDSFCSKYFVNRVENKEVMQFKGLSVGDNTNSNYVNATTDIGLSQAELQDVVMPVIFNALNENTVTWDLLSKDNMASQGTNRITFVLKTGNTGAYFSKSNAITITTTDREKYSTEYKKLYIGGGVDGDLQAYSRGGPFGEALALEMADRAIAMKVKANQALFDENSGNKADVAPLGIPALTDSAGNTTLYDTTRSAANKLAPDAAADTYVDASGGLTEGIMRQMIEQAETDGAQLDDLVFVGTPAVINKYKALFDGRTRLVPYSDRAGFKNAPEYEGVPLFSDKDSKADSLFLIDTKALRIGILVPFTPEMLGKRSDSEEFFMKSYYGVYCTAPRRLVEAYDIV